MYQCMYDVHTAPVNPLIADIKKDSPVEGGVALVQTSAKLHDDKYEYEFDEPMFYAFDDDNGETELTPP